MPTLRSLMTKGVPAGPQRVAVDAGTWLLACNRLKSGALTLCSLWGEERVVHMALLDEATGDLGVISLDCPGGRFPSVGALHPPAIRLERAIRDLHGLIADDAPDTRPWLDHGRWKDSAAKPYVFLPVEGESLHQIAVGPVHAGIIEPGQFLFTASGEAIVRLEERLGFVHKGIENLMAGADLERGAKLASRTSGDSTVAYALAFARAAEAALAIQVPPRAVWVRALMAELERIANHLGDIGAVCNDAAFAMMHAQCAILREQVLRTADLCFGHRLMMDCIVPGGTAEDFAGGSAVILRTLIGELRFRFPSLVRLYDETASLQDRTVGTGILRREFARQFGCGGFVGRASGRAFDTRRHFPYPPYDRLKFDVPVREDGDVNARIWIRIREVEQSLSLIDQILDALPSGDFRANVPVISAPCEDMSFAEGFRGDVFVWLCLGADGKIERCHLRDPSWFQWPLLEAAINGNIVADFPLCNKSFNCSYSGHDS